MKTYITHNAMVDALLSDDYANWSYKGADALIDYLEELEIDLGTELEFDRVALRCEFAEYKTMGEALEDYGLSRSCELRDSTTVIDFDGGVIVQNF
jgi:hypothetical protein